MSREQLYERYKEADVYIQVGWRPEGTSISLLYAMAFGLPSIVPRDTGLAWQAGDSALTVENGNHDELARAIERLGEDAALREKLSAACYGRMFSDELDHEKVIGAWAAMMEAVRAAQVRAS
jgi:glycosyltransferase involved in cell wall biosynthesis